MRKCNPLKFFRCSGSTNEQTGHDKQSCRLRLPLCVGGATALCVLVGGGIWYGVSLQKAPALPPAEAATPAPEPEGPSAVELARNAVYRQLWQNIGPLVAERALMPEFNEPAKVYLEALNAYYSELATLPPSMERADVARRLAELTCNLGAYAKAIDAFERALEDFEALPEGTRSTVEAKRLHSALLNGMGVCLLSIGKGADALPYYEKALEVDIAVLRDLGVGEEAELPSGTVDANISCAVADVLGSYRCLGECHAIIGDLEDAREIYNKGIGVMMQLKNLDVNSGMSISFVKLYGTLGDLENRCGNGKAAITAWARAAELCKEIFNNSRTDLVKQQAMQFLKTLNPLIAEQARKLQEAARAQQEAQSAREAAEAAEAAREAEEARKAAEAAAAAQAEQDARAAEEAARAAEAEKAAAAAKAEQPKEERRRSRSRRSRNRR